MKRVEKLREIIKRESLDGIFLKKKSNVNYISRFPDEGAYVLITLKNNFLFTDGRFIELAKDKAKGFTVIDWTKYNRNLSKAIIDICNEEEVKNLAFEKDTVTVDFYENLLKESNKLNLKLIPKSGLVEELRYIKDEEEIAYIEKACEIGDKSLEQLLKDIKVGVSENDLVGKLEYYIRMNGGQGVGFETILISGKKTSLPHGKPSEKLIENRDFITIDFGVLYKGYTSDMTRTFIVGEPSEKQKHIYNLVKEGQQVGLNTLKAGVSAKEPDDNIRKIIKEYEKYYYAGIGHGVGLELHEEPFLGNYGNRILEENSVITMEPGLYIPDFGGVRIEDTVVITKEGYKKLTKFPKELMILY